MPTAQAAERRDDLLSASQGLFACKSRLPRHTAWPTGQATRYRAACKRDGRGTRENRPTCSRPQTACGESPRDCLCRKTPPPASAQRFQGLLLAARGKQHLQHMPHFSSHIACGASCSTCRRIANRAAGSSMSARERATTSARRSPLSGSRSVPCGKTCPKPNGSRRPAARYPGRGRCGDVGRRR